MADTLKCPRTGVILTPKAFGEIEVHLSEGNGGVWFDQFELEKFKWEDIEAGERLIEVMEKFHKNPANPDERLKCPRCDDVVLKRRYYSPLRKVEIDECPGCAGIWLEAGDLAEIRNLFPTPEERERVGKEFVDEFMNSPEVKEFQAESTQSWKRTERIGTVLTSILLPFRRR